MKEQLNLSSLNFFEALFKRLKENTALIMNSEGIILEINSAFSTAFGYEKDDIVGRNFSILFTEESIQKDMPKREIRMALKEGQAFDNNYLVRKDKKQVWVNGESVLLKDAGDNSYILKLIYDIQVQKESEASIIQLSDFNDQVLGAIEDVVIVLNEEQVIEKANRSFFELFKNISPEALKTNLSSLMDASPRSLKFLKSITAVFDSGEGFRHKSLTLLTPENVERVFDVNAVYLSKQAGAKQLLLILHEITVHVQIEREREDIIGFVAHELRNPLANIMLCNELILSLVMEGDKEKVLSYVARSKKNALRLNQMVTELYDATKVSSGNFKLELTKFVFSDMVNEAVHTIEILQPAYSIRVIDSATGVSVTADRYRLVQVVTNFLSNGIKYSNGNTTIDITIEANKDMATVSVKDRGMGIEKAQIPHIFERFFRAEKTKNMEGIGLGLYLCHQIILPIKERSG